MSAAEAPTERSLAAFLAWLGAPDLTVVAAPEDQPPTLDGARLRLPLDPQAWAAAAHAAAHRRFSQHRFPAQALTPITRALLGVLEDARVEWLAQHGPGGLPGLARVWAPAWSTLPTTGTSFEALLGRLTRALADPATTDDHPWVRKGVGLFFADPSRQALAVPTGDPQALRVLAGRLGHDIGQARLPFNDRTYRVAPAYRDDHCWLWEAAVAPEPQEAPAPPEPGAGPAETTPTPVALEEVHRYPEWDRLIGRARPRWCTVRWRRATGPGPRPPDPGLVARVARRWAGERPRSHRPGPLGTTGDDLDLTAAIEAWADQQAGRPTEARVYRRHDPTTVPCVLQVLVDGSASTAALGDRLRVAARVAAAAWRASRGPAEVVVFRSWGREAVEVWEDGDGVPWAAAGSTRLGAVVRDAHRRLGRAPGWVLVLTDGQPHDVDCHDPRYLVEDARRALADLRRAGHRAGALVAGSVVDDADERRRMEHWCGRGAWAPLPHDLGRLRLPG